MNKEQVINCIVCPNSCSLQVKYCNKEVIEVQGASCERGIEYATNEIVNPVRNIITTVKVNGGILPLVSVRSDKPIPKNKLIEAVKFLQGVEVDAPIAFHGIIFKDILGTRVNVIATREIEQL